jgi:hypothetical protein
MPLDQRLVHGHRLQARSALKIASAVSGVDHPRPRPDHQRRRQRGPHAEKLGVGIDVRQDLLMAPQHALGQQLGRVDLGHHLGLRGAPPDEFAHRLDRQGAGAVPRRSAADPVRHREQPGRGRLDGAERRENEVVLVHLALGARQAHAVAVERDVGGAFVRQRIASGQRTVIRHEPSGEDALSTTVRR